MKHSTTIIALIAGVFLLWPRGDSQREPDPVSQAFDQYEALWRLSAQKAAEALAAGDLTSDSATHEFISKAGEQSRRDAFQPIADAEQAALTKEVTDENGKVIAQQSIWTPEKHAAILRGYAK